MAEKPFADGTHFFVFKRRLAVVCILGLAVVMGIVGDSLLDEAAVEH